MRTIVSLAIGFWLGREIYIKYDKEEALKKEQAIKKRLKTFLEKNGLSQNEVKEETNEILGLGA